MKTAFRTAAAALLIVSFAAGAQARGTLQTLPSNSETVMDLSVPR